MSIHNICFSEAIRKILSGYLVNIRILMEESLLITLG